MARGVATATLSTGGGSPGEAVYRGATATPGGAGSVGRDEPESRPTPGGGLPVGIGPAGAIPSSEKAGSVVFGPASARAESRNRVAFADSTADFGPVTTNRYAYGFSRRRRPFAYFDLSGFAPRNSRASISC